MTSSAEQATLDLTATPGQTVGPFFGYALPFDRDNELVPPGRADAIRLHGTVRDGSGQPVPDALLELWQLDPSGAVVQREGLTAPRRMELHRLGARVDRRHRPLHVQHGAAGAESGKAPFFAVTVFARGLTNRLFTRAYLPHDAEALAADPLLASLDADERDTLVTTADEQGYVFDVRLQGDGETVFLSFT